MSLCVLSTCLFNHSDCYPARRVQTGRQRYDLFQFASADIAVTGLRRQLLPKPSKPPARVINIRIDFCIAESNELPPVSLGKEGFTRHAG